jgi:biopolymer transport protein ExbD
MQARLKQRLEQQSAHHIDMSPLLDVVFILLIFFIVTTVFVRESGVEVDKPQAVSASRLEQQVIFLAITDSQQVYFDGSQIGVAGVRSSVEQMLKQQQRPVVIQADKTVPTELLVKVIDDPAIICKIIYSHHNLQ